MGRSGFAVQSSGFGVTSGLEFRLEVEGIAGAEGGALIEGGFKGAQRGWTPRRGFKGFRRNTYRSE